MDTTTTATAAPPTAATCTSAEAGGRSRAREVVLHADVTFDRRTVGEFLQRIDEALRSLPTPSRLVLEMTDVEIFDSAGIGAVVAGVRRARARGVDVRLRGMSQPMLDFCSLLSIERLLEDAGPGRRRLDPVSRLGETVSPLLDGLRDIGTVAVEALHGLFVAPFRGHRIRFDRVLGELDKAANGALPIVVLIGFLLGLTLAMQAWGQLRMWGAEIYVADMVGVSVMTEIGPLMTAIVLAARSGSSNAAQLGSMVVGEEIDALKQMGVHPIRFLVVPKVLAMAVAMVGLTVVFDVVGICGGALFARLAGDIGFSVYKDQTGLALMPVDFLLANLKSLVFGLCVGVVGCALGLKVSGGSEGVGRATTNAVVVSIFAIIVIDACFVAAQRLLLVG